MPGFERTRRAAAAMNERTKDAAQKDLPAQNIRNQLPARTIPPASSTTRGGVMLSDDDPLANDTTADPGTSPAASRADHVHPDSGGGGGALDVTDGTTTVSPTTTLRFPAGTIADNTGGEAEYTPAGGGSGVAANSFYAHKNGTDQNVTNSTFVGNKITFDTESWDTGGWWDASTSTLQPDVACKMEITVAYTWAANGAYRNYVTLYKNGARFRETISHSAIAETFTSQATFTVEMNGTTDTVELYAFQNSGGTRTLYGDPLGTWISGKRVE